MPYDSPPLTALRAFEAAARHGSFKRAAEELCVTPSSVSHQVQRLEEWLETKLFQRLNRKVILTDEGRTYFFTLSKAFEDIDTVTGLVSNRRTKSPSKQRLKIVADAGFVECWLGPRLAKLQALMPDVQLDIAFGEDIDDYIKGGADLAIHFGRGDWPEYKSEFLRTGYEFPVCSPELVGAEGAPPELADLTLLHEKNMSGWLNWLRAARLQHPDVQGGAILHSTSTIFDKVMSCDGIGLGDDIVAADLLFSGALAKPWGAVRKSDHSLYFLQFGLVQGADIAEKVQAWLQLELETHKTATALLRTDKPFSVSRDQQTKKAD